MLVGILNGVNQKKYNLQFINKNQFYEFSDLDDNPEEDGLTRKYPSVSLYRSSRLWRWWIWIWYRNLSRSSTNIEEVTRLKPSYYYFSIFFIYIFS